MSWPEKVCVGCGESFTPHDRNPHQKRCKQGCSRSDTSRNGVRIKEREAHDLEFIGVDGEGVNRAGAATVTYSETESGEYEERVYQVPAGKNGDRHDYVMLTVGKETLHKDGRNLTHRDIFPFLYAQFEAHPNAAFVGFALGYDFTMWLRSIHANRAWELLTKEGIANRQLKSRDVASGARRFPKPVRDAVYESDVWWPEEFDAPIVVDAKWEIDILGYKRFKLRPYTPWDKRPTKTEKNPDGTTYEKRIGAPWMFVVDAFSFFQASFLKVIAIPDEKEKAKGAVQFVSEEEYAIIKEGKDNRSTAQFGPEMMQYNTLENEVLARIMRRMNLGFVKDGIKLRKNQFMGPGQAAQAWMRKMEVPLAKDVNVAIPGYAKQAAQYSYYGGWFEIFNHGPVPGASYDYDINSAYPAIIAQLPCMLHGKWTQGVGTPPQLPRNSYRLEQGEFYGKDRWIGPLPFRTKTGNILRPGRGKGWYWNHEIKASRRAGLLARFKTERWVQYDPCDCPPPMADIRELYQGRLQVGKATPEGKAKKLVYNSSYGKCAQSVGYPVYANSFYASLITSGCRTQILDAIATHPNKSDDVLMIATDGIVFKNPHPNLPMDKEELGKWSAKEFENLSLFMPGLYWDDRAREAIAKGEIPDLKSRGVSPKYLGTIVEEVDKGWERLRNREPGVYEPTVTLTVDWALVGAKLAIVRGAWETAGTNQYAEPRVMSGSILSKRSPIPGTFLPWFYPYHGGLRSRPYEESPDGRLETTYYDKKFGDLENRDDEVIEDEWNEFVTQDGTLDDIMGGIVIGRNFGE